ncbi:MAG: ribosome maturation factor RimP [Nevskiales bacterium]
MLTERLRTLLEPAVQSVGCELWHLELEGQGHGQRLRVYIDALAGVRLEDCERVSRELSAVLDVDDPIHGSYQLEVSSPGLDRLLVRPEHYVRYIGQEAKFVLRQPVEGARKWRGRILTVEADVVRIVSEGRDLTLPFVNVTRARLVPDYEREFQNRHH